MRLEKFFRFLRKLRKPAIFFTVVLTGVLFFSAIGTIAIDFYVSHTGKKYVVSIPELSGDFDCIIVPGASVLPNKTPSAILKDRLDVAYDVYQATDIKRILVSGDHGSVNYDEVNVMRNYLIDKGIPSADIFMDHAGFDTYQTLYRARDIFEIKRAVIVTQDFHLYRSLYIAHKLNIDVLGIDSAVRAYGRDFYNRLREFPARVKAFAECEIFKPKPDYLGEKIPISGENVTVD